MISNPDAARAWSDETSSPDIICFSHLRWNFVFQRPQHLMTRLGKRHRVFFVEEPQFDDGPDRIAVTVAAPGVTVVVPILSKGRAASAGDVAAAEASVVQSALLKEMMAAQDVSDYVLWYYTPMGVAISRSLSPIATVYDCMDELTGFANAPSQLSALEAELLSRADLVTTGGQSLYEAKRERHRNVHAFPSSIDVVHFAAARAVQAEPLDQAHIPHPRLGFAGVIDERMDLDLLKGVAEQRPEWQLVLLGPVLKVDPGALPRLPNVHLLGMKTYQELPRYFSGWDVGVLPFAHNAATRFISPTKTPEYLAAGLPVVSTSIHDVVSQYGDSGHARIADGVGDFVNAVSGALAEGRCARVQAVDTLLRRGSWDATAEQMRGLMLKAIRSRATFKTGQGNYSNMSGDVL
jgi:glycosyltransferase involved in cell wall biosynthesis